MLANECHLVELCIIKFLNGTSTFEILSTSLNKIKTPPPSNWFIFWDHFQNETDFVCWYGVRRHNSQSERLSHRRLGPKMLRPMEDQGRKCSQYGYCASWIWYRSWVSRHEIIWAIFYVFHYVKIARPLSNY